MVPDTSILTIAERLEVYDLLNVANFSDLE